ncbi:MAG TPA: Gfo/Idh/MocA family oxidoreductase, partial [Candidatus Hydrogenedentes bacterium]|nr:Gfo/Idh/MocA family oxidoreductase [Candidatus Hydrogenedentota bacterium]
MGKRFSRREFLGTAVIATAGCATGKRVAPATAPRAAPAPSGRATIRVGVIGCGARGTVLLQDLLQRQRNAAGVHVAGVCDVYAPRLERAKAMARAAFAYRDWQELVDLEDIDAIVIATPNHWHAPMTVAALETGKDVYCETPMARTVPEALAVRDCARRTGRVCQIGATEVAAGRWEVVRSLIGGEVVGPVRWIHANPAPKRLLLAESEPMPDTLDWAAFTGNGPPIAFDPDRYLHWRRYWDYSGGAALDSFYPVFAALLEATGPELPERV